MSKFKVGDKVRIVTSCYSKDSGLTTGSVHNVVGVGGGFCYLKTKYPNSSDTTISFTDYELEHYPSNKLKVGQTYTSENGSEWECIFVRGDMAWMIGVYPDGAKGSAYDFDIDGTASWAGGSGAEAYNINWGPKLESVTVRGGMVVGYLENSTIHPEYADFTFNMQIDLIDGTPDWTTAKVSPCD